MEVSSAKSSANEVKCAISACGQHIHDNKVRLVVLHRSFSYVTIPG